MQELPSDIFLHHILPFVGGCYRVVISLANTCSQLRNKFKQLSLTLQFDEGRKCFRTIHCVTDLATSGEWTAEINDGFIGVLESGLFSKVCVSFKWVKLSERMVKLLTKEKMCLNLISQIEVFNCYANVESLILNANWKQLSTIKFATIEGVDPPPKKEIVDFRKLSMLEVLECNQNFKLEIPNRSIKDASNSSNLRELSISNQSSGFISKLYRELKFPNIEKLELKKCNLKEVNFSSILVFNNLKSLNIDCRLSGNQYSEIFQNEKLVNLESLELVIDKYKVLQKLFKTAVFSKSLTKLLVKHEPYQFNFFRQYWKDNNLWKVLSKERFPKLKEFSVSSLESSVKKFRESKLEIERLNVYDLHFSQLDDWRTFKNLTELKFDNWDGHTLPLHFLTNLKSLSLRCDTYNSELILDLPKLERLELKGCKSVVFSCKEYPNLTYISIGGNALNKTVDAICKTSLQLETFVFCGSDCYQDNNANDLGMETLLGHANFSKLKNLQVDCALLDDTVELLANSQLDLDYLVLNSPFFSGNAAYELCDGSIQCKLLKIGFQHILEDGYCNFSGSIPDLVQYLIQQENVECNADFIEPNWCFGFPYYKVPLSVSSTYEDITDVFGRKIISELTPNLEKKKNRF